MRNVFGRILPLAVLAFLAGCGSDDGTAPTTLPPPPIDATGGVVGSSAKNAWVVIPGGAISGAALQITITELDRSGFPDPAGRWTNVFEIGPDGANFDIPVTVALTLPDTLADSSATLWGLNTTTNQWEEIADSYTSLGNVWGLTTHFSTYSVAEASNPDTCAARYVNLHEPGFVTVIPGRFESDFLIAPNSLHEQEAGSKWIATKDTVNVSGVGGPPMGFGMWIDFATGPNYETGNFVIDAGGNFDFDIDIPPGGYRLLGLTDACYSATATPESGWLYNLEIWCDAGCQASSFNPERPPFK